MTETSVGVQFAPLTGWDVNLLGLYQESIKGEFPKFQSAPFASLGPQQPAFIIGSPRVRGLYTSADDTKLLQIQDDMFFVNWRKTDDKAQYIRYESVREVFESQWTAFRSFLMSRSISMPAIARYQVTYVNHTPVGELNSGDLLTAWNGDEGVSNLTIAASYRLGDGIDVTLNLNPGVRLTDGFPMVRLTIATTLNLSEPRTDEQPLKNLDVLHDRLIETFQKITSDRARALWKQL